MKIKLLVCWAIFSVATVSVAFSYSSQGTLAPASFLSEDENATASLKVPETGLYVLASTSSESSSFELVDRMSGQIAQTFSSQNSMTKVFSARVDVLLTRGEYQVRVHKSKKDKLYLELKSVEVVNAQSGLFDVPELKSLQSLSLTLKDRQAYGFWVRVTDKDSLVRLNAMGRSLRRAILWKDGFWDEAISFSSQEREFIKGRPLQQIELNGRLEPGNYLLTLFGGSPKDWALQTPDEPLYVSRDAVELGNLGSQQVTLDTSGTASFLVAPGTALAQLLTPNAVKASIQSASASEGNSRYSQSRFQTIDDKKPARLISISLGSSSQQWVTVVGPPGTSYTLNLVPNSVLGGGGGNIWNASLGVGDRGALVQWGAEWESLDALPSSWIVLSDVWSKQNRSVVLENALVLSPQSPIRSAFNNTSEGSLIVRVQQKGSYAAIVKDSGTADATFAFQPLEDFLNGSNSQPQRINSGSSVDLDAKFYIVTVTPKKLNRLDFVLVSAGFDQGFKASSLMSQSAPTTPLVRNVVVGPKGAVSQTLFAGNRSANDAVFVRPFPIDLAIPLVLSLQPGQSLSIPFASKQNINFFWEGRADAVTVDSTQISNGGAVGAGDHTLTVSNASASQTSIRFYQKTAGGEQIASVPTDASVPTGYDTLAVGRPVFADWDRSETKRFLVQVETPGLYKLETTGRLSFSIVVRSYLNRNLSGAQTNYSGENAQVLSYLKPGYYLVEVKTVNRTTGRAGLTFAFQEKLDAPVLVEPSVVRSWVPPQTLLSLPIKIERSGSYKLTQLGLDQAFNYRLEDQDGWPVNQIVSSTSQSVYLKKGLYRLTSFSINASSRRIYTVANEETQTVASANVNSNKLELNVPVSRTWKESTPRKDDEFWVEVPTNLTVRIRIDASMKYEVRSPSGKTIVKADGGKLVPITLEVGKNQILVRSKQVDNLVPYQIQVESLDLSEGQSVAVQSGSGIPVSIGREATYEFWSFGPHDWDLALWKVNAEGQGERIAVGQTMKNDWNQKIVASLKPGRYFVQVGGLTSPQNNVSSPQPEESNNEEEQPRYDNEESYESENSHSYSDDAQDVSYSDEGDSSGDDGGSDGEGSDNAVEEDNSSSQPALQWSPYLGAFDGTNVLQFFSRTEKKIDKGISGSGDLALSFAGEIQSVDFDTTSDAVYQISSDAGDSLNVALYKNGTQVVSQSGTVFLPLPAKTKYKIQFWFDDQSARSTQVSIKPVAETALSLDAGSASIVPKTTVIRVSDPVRLSRVVRSSDGEVWTSTAYELPCDLASDRPLRGANETFWIVVPPGRTAGSISIEPLEMTGESGAALELRSSQMARIKVPEGRVSVATTSNNGQSVGISVSPWGSKDEGSNWSKVSVTATQTWAGLRSGDYRARVWDAVDSDSLVARTVQFGLKSYPLTTTLKLESGQALQTQVEGACAITVKSETKKAVHFILERGMVAFSGEGRSDGVLVAENSVVHGVLVGTTFTVVNTSPQALQFKAEVTSAADRPVLSSLDGIELVQSEPKILEFDVQFDSAGAKTFLAGQFDSAYLFEEETGKILAPTLRSTPVGSVAWFDGKKGRLVVQAAKGFVKVWGASISKETQVFVPSSWGDRPKLTLEGSKVSAGNQSFSFSAAQTGYVSFSLDSPGFLGVYKADGTLLQGSLDAQRRSVLIRLSPGTYSVFARPFQGGAQSGALRVNALSPVAVASSGEASTQLISSGEAHLYQFTLKSETAVACGVRAQYDGLSVALFDPNFTLIDRGALFFRTLKPGTYSMLVSADDGSQKYRAVFFGVEGNRTDVPQDVKNSYLKDLEE